MKYYVYTLARPDGTVFYVGKGSGDRIKHHEQEALRGHDCPKCTFIRVLWAEGGAVQRAIVFETDNERAALAHEAELIRSYGYDQLVNRLPGGRGRARGPRRRSRQSPRVRLAGDPVPPTLLPVEQHASPEATDLLVANLVNRLFDTHRKENGQEWTNQEIAERLNYELSTSAISKIRNGRITNPGRNVLLLLCRAFSVEPAYFFPELAKPIQDELSDDELQVALRSYGLNTEARRYLLGLANILKRQGKEE